MKTLSINQQKPSSTFWNDETGAAIPFKYVPKHAKNAEKTVCSLAKEALRLNTALTAFKHDLKKKVLDLYAEFLEVNNGKIGKGKGGITFFNFDRSIKVEVQVNEPISFDKNTIGLAKQKLDEFLEASLEGVKDFIKPIITDAFETRAGQLDTSRILGLRKYIAQANDARFTEAMGLVDQAIRRTSTKEYFRVWIKDEAGEYQDVQLNFASITVAA